MARIDRLPDTAGLPNVIILPRSHRNGYDHALRAAGARIVEVGVAERTRDPQPWEIAAAITERTVALAFSVGFSPLKLTDVAAVAQRHKLPLIVDASAALPPKGNLRRFIAEGADLVAFSGGKAIRGPQASGILCGRRDLDCLGRAADVGPGFSAGALESAGRSDRPGNRRARRAESRHRPRHEGWQGGDRRAAGGCKSDSSRKTTPPNRRDSPRFLSKSPPGWPGSKAFALRSSSELNCGPSCEWNFRQGAPRKPQSNWPGHGRRRRPAGLSGHWRRRQRPTGDRSVLFAGGRGRIVIERVRATLQRVDHRNPLGKNADTQAGRSIPGRYDRLDLDSDVGRYF